MNLRVSIQRATVALAFASLLSAQATKPSATPPPFTPTVSAPELHLSGDNLTDIKQQIYTYAQSGQYNREVNQVVKAAHDWIETRVARATPGEKLAAVFDIDETSLTNLGYMLDCGLCSSAAQAKLYPTDALRPIPATLDLFNFAKSKGVALFFVTGRYDTGRDLTARTLENAGYSDWTDLLMRPSGNSNTAAVMKSGVRAGIEKKGYKIIMNIGDQLSDLVGGYSERTYKLPDPFYFVE